MSSDPQTRVREALREHVDSLPTPAENVEVVLARATRRSAASPARKRLRWLAPAGAAIAVAAAIGAALVVPRHDEPAPPAIPWLPAKITAPDTKPPALPAERAVGKGSVIYSVCKEPNRPSTCREYVIAEDGSHYRIPWTSDKWGNEDDLATLSPDGRWLGATREGEYVLRDLTGVRTYRIAGRKLVALAWSPDSRWLVIGLAGVTSGKGVPKQPVLRVDTRTGETRQVTAPFEVSSYDVVDVYRSGKVLLTVPDGEMPRPGVLPDLALIDPARGSEPLWTKRLDSTPLRHGTPEEHETATGMRLTPDGRSLLVALSKSVEMPSGRAWSPASGDLVLFDLATGVSTRRYDILDGTLKIETNERGGEASGPETSWGVMANEGEGILLKGVEYGGSWDNSHLVGSQLDLVDPETGEQRTVSRASGVTLIAVRGTTPFS